MKLTVALQLDEWPVSRVARAQGGNLECSPTGSDAIYLPRTQVCT
jgi:hypothetical protein